MSRSNMLGNEQEIGSHAQIFIYRIPKKNHDAIVQLNKQIKDTLPEHRTSSLGILLSQQYRDCNGLCKHNRNCIG